METFEFCRTYQKEKDKALVTKKLSESHQRKGRRNTVSHTGVTFCLLLTLTDIGFLRMIPIPIFGYLKSQYVGKYFFLISDTWNRCISLKFVMCKYLWFLTDIIWQRSLNVILLQRFTDYSFTLLVLLGSVDRCVCGVLKLLPIRMLQCVLCGQSV